ncbi:MAG: CheF family chemotaxis protein [Halobacteriota archaeon]|nr:CheF family chemotaxis protein [Halobacteriota archaeon]
MPKEKVLFRMDGEAINLGIGATTVNRSDWKRVKVVLTHTNLWIMHNSAKERIPLNAITGVGRDVSTKISMPIDKYLAIDYISDGKTFINVITSTKDQVKKLKSYILLVQLNNTSTYLLHPSKIGGVLQTGTKWQKRVLTISKGTSSEGITDQLVFKMDGEEDVKILLSRVEQTKTEERLIGKATREVLNITHNTDENTFNTCVFIKNMNPLKEYFNDFMLDKGVETRVSIDTSMGNSGTGPELSEKEDEIMIALYSGVSSLEMETMMDNITVDELEKIYDKMIRDGMAETIRIRKEIQLTAKGKNIVNKKMAI